MKKKKVNRNTFHLELYYIFFFKQFHWNKFPGAFTLMLIISVFFHSILIIQINISLFLISRYFR